MALLIRGGSIYSPRPLGENAPRPLDRSEEAFDLQADLLDHGRMAARKVCTTCSLCSHLLRRQRPVGCVVRDPEYKNADREGGPG